MANKVVFTNGCFDILHVGHLELFKYCKSLGDYLIVAIDEDDRIKKNKGPTRPINCLDDRVAMLSAIKYIDEVRHFSSDSELTSLVKSSNPDYMVVGDDYLDKTVIGSQYAKQLKFFRKVDGYSSTKTIQNISNR